MVDNIKINIVWCKIHAGFFLEEIKKLQMWKVYEISDDWICIDFDF